MCHRDKNPFDKTDRKKIAVFRRVTETKIPLTKQERGRSIELCHRDKVSYVLLLIFSSQLFSCSLPRKLCERPHSQSISQNGIILYGSNPYNYTFKEPHVMQYRNIEIIQCYITMI